MKTAFLYAGQGSQKVGMGEDLYSEFPEFKEVFDNVSLDFDLKGLCFRDPNKQLGQTRYTQPCMVAFACGVTKILQNKGIKPDMVAGLSLGEYSALQAAGVWSVEEAIKLASFRGKAMTEAAKDIDSGMVAVIGMNKNSLQECVSKARDIGQVYICNDNCPGQLVIGGEKNAVERAALMAKEKGAKMCVPLNVSGPFHTPFMRDAGEKLALFFEKISFAEEKIPVVFNCIGRERTKEESVQELLVKQVQSEVKMTDSISYMLDREIRKFVEIGPGKVLTGFVKQCAKEKNISNIECITLEKPEDIKKYIEDNK